jgi:hypothetical protein
VCLSPLDGIMLMGCSVGRGYLLLVPLASVAPPTAVGSFFLLAVLILEGDEHPAFKAGARTLQAGVVGLYSVVVTGVAVLC